MSASSHGDPTRRLVVLVLTALWGLRLGLYICNRNRGHGEDKRYTALMKTRTGSLVGFLVRKIYGMQGILLLVISLPIQFAMYQPQPLGVVGMLGILLWAIGFGFEAVGDWQLSRFKADPANAGGIMDRGLWAWTRHPNYFGDACVWVGLFLLALGSPWGLISVVSPIVMTTLLLRYSGKALLEKGMRRSRGSAFDDYVSRTSGFFPRPPRRSPKAGADGRRALP
jgi:steroid 5-alpha reductase family enzyme